MMGRRLTGCSKTCESLKPPHLDLRLGPGALRGREGHDRCAQVFADLLDRPGPSKRLAHEPTPASPPSAVSLLTPTLVG